MYGLCAANFVKSVPVILMREELINTASIEFDSLTCKWDLDGLLIYWRCAMRRCKEKGCDRVMGRCCIMRIHGNRSVMNTLFHCH